MKRVSKMSTRQDIPCKVVAWPAFKNRKKNPYNSLLYTALKRSGAVDVSEFSPSSALRPINVFHVHWPEDFSNKQTLRGSILTLLVLVTVTALTRMQRGKVVWTAHNLYPHDRRRPVLEQVYRLLFLRMVTDVIHLTRAGRAELQGSAVSGCLKKAVHHVIPHGPYDVMEIAKVQERRSPTALVVGQLRPYKLIVEFIDVWKSASLDDWHLIIAGSSDGSGYADLIRERIGDLQNVELIDRWLTDADISELLDRVDVVVVTAQRHNSGVLYLALSSRTPVLTPASNAAAEVSDRVGSDWIVPYPVPVEPEQLQSALETAVSVERNTDAVIPTWDEIAAETLIVYRHNKF